MCECVARVEGPSLSVIRSVAAHHHGSKHTTTTFSEPGRIRYVGESAPRLRSVVVFREIWDAQVSDLLCLSSPLPDDISSSERRKTSSVRLRLFAFSKKDLRLECCAMQGYREELGVKLGVEGLRFGICVR